MVTDNSNMERIFMVNWQLKELGTHRRNEEVPIGMMEVLICTSDNVK